MTRFSKITTLGLFFIAFNSFVVKLLQTLTCKVTALLLLTVGIWMEIIKLMH